MYYPPSSLIATGIIFGLLCLLSTCLRFYVRQRHKTGPIGVDDWLIVIAAVIVTTLDVLMVEDTIHGVANTNHKSAAAAVESHKINYFEVVSEKMAYGCIKLSFLTFYRRIFSPWSDFKKINNVLVAIVTAWMLAYFISAIFVCGTHPAAQWGDPSIASKQCYDNGTVLFSFAVTDVITDLVVLSLPFAFIHRLRMNRRKKWAVGGIFALGFLSTLAGVLRLAFISVIFALKQFKWDPPPLKNPPQILKVVNPVFWTNVELTFGVITANLPPLWPLVRNAPSFKQFCAVVHRKVSNRFESSTGSRSQQEPSTAPMTTVWTDKNGTVTTV